MTLGKMSRVSEAKSRLLDAVSDIMYTLTLERNEFFYFRGRKNKTINPLFNIPTRKIHNMRNHKNSLAGGKEQLISLFFHYFNIPNFVFHSLNKY